MYIYINWNNPNAVRAEKLSSVHGMCYVIYVVWLFIHHLIYFSHFFMYSEIMDDMYHTCTCTVRVCIALLQTWI